MVLNWGLGYCYKYSRVGEEQERPGGCYKKGLVKGRNTNMSKKYGARAFYRVQKHGVSGRMFINLILSIIYYHLYPIGLIPSKHILIINITFCRPLETHVKLQLRIIQGTYLI